VGWFAAWPTVTLPSPRTPPPPPHSPTPAQSQSRSHVPPPSRDCSRSPLYCGLPGCEALSIPCVQCFPHPVIPSPSRCGCALQRTRITPDSSLRSESSTCLSSSSNWCSGECIISPGVSTADCVALALFCCRLVLLGSPAWCCCRVHVVFDHEDPTPPPHHSLSCNARGRVSQTVRCGLCA
jgi:hypothetical protein